MYAYIDELMGAIVIAVCGAVATRGVTLFELNLFPYWVRLTNLYAIFGAVIVGICTTIVSVRLRRRRWSVEGTLLLVALAISSTGWYLVQLGLSYSAKSSEVQVTKARSK